MISLITAVNYFLASRTRRKYGFALGVMRLVMDNQRRKLIQMSIDGRLLTKTIGREFRRIQCCTVLHHGSSAKRPGCSYLCPSFAIESFEIAMNSLMTNTKRFERYSDLPDRQCGAHPALSTQNRHPNLQSPNPCNNN
jgi:hypothetical protein